MDFEDALEGVTYRGPGRRWAGVPSNTGLHGKVIEALDLLAQQPVPNAEDIEACRLLYALQQNGTLDELSSQAPDFTEHVEPVDLSDLV